MRDMLLNISQSVVSYFSAFISAQVTVTVIAKVQTDTYNSFAPATPSGKRKSLKRKQRQ